MKELVIEGESLVRGIYLELLELLGHEPSVTGDGRERVARFGPLVHEIGELREQSGEPAGAAR